MKGFDFSRMGNFFAHRFVRDKKMGKKIAHPTKLKRKLDIPDFTNPNNNFEGVVKDATSQTK